jgi:uncharacterized membrane protein YkvA (DUF1232 family)
MNISIDALKESIQRSAHNVKQEDIKKIMDDSDRLMHLFQNRHLKKFIEDLKLLILLLRDYWTGKYREIPWGSIATIVAALLYVFSPLDLIPDMVPFVGFLDDALVVNFCLKIISRDLENYKRWKKKG